MVAKVLNLSYFFLAETAICIVKEALPGGGGGVAHVARRNFKTARVGVYKCFAVTVAIWP